MQADYRTGREASQYLGRGNPSGSIAGTGGVAPSLPVPAGEKSRGAAATVCGSAGAAALVGGAGSLLETTGNKSTDLSLDEWKKEQELQLRRRRRRDQKKLMSDLRSLGLDVEANQVRQCGQLWGYKHDACGGVFYRSYGISCQNPLCSYCLHERAARLAGEWTPILSEFASPSHLTLTLRRYAGESLDAMGGRFDAACASFLRSAEFRRHVRGGVLSREVAVSKGAWGVHGHMLIDCDYWDVRAISALWEQITGDSKIVYIKRVTPGDADSLADAIAEVIKYPCKVASVLGDPELVQEYLDWVKGRRMFRAFGSCVGALKRHREQLAAAAGKSLAEVEEEEHATTAAEREELRSLETTCPGCGARGADLVPVYGLVAARWDCRPVNALWWAWDPLSSSGDPPAISVQ